MGGDHLRPEVLAEAKAEVLHELLPAIDDVTDAGVACPDSSVASGVPDLHPSLAHVLEADRAGLLMLEIGDQLSEDPSLVGVLDTPVLVLHDRLGEDPPPGQVEKVNPAQLSSVNDDGCVARATADLVGDRQNRVEAMVSGQVQIVRDLVDLEGRIAGLDLDQAFPRRLAAFHTDDAVWPQRLAVGVLQRNLREGRDPARGGADVAQQAATKLVDRAHHREKRRGGPDLLLLLSTYSRYGNQAGGHPRMIRDSGFARSVLWHVHLFRQSLPRVVS